MTVQIRQEDPRSLNSTAQRPATGFRPDLEGLRAVAVGLVLFDHIIHWPTGGFVGVDVFFVLSGFLITGLLLKEHSRTGRISFRSFYARRVKRILPAATLVIAVTTIASYAVFVGARLTQTLSDSLYALLFAANWRFVLVGQDYFAADRAISPFQHYWSLAVEEQFYIVWPLLMLGVLAACQRRSQKSRERALILVFGLVIVASFGWSILETTANPTTAYFSTFSRAWELAAGGLLAVVASRMPALKRHVRLTIASVGLLIIFLGAVLINPQLPFPGPWALLPVVGTLLIIGAGIGATVEGLHPALTANPVRYVGRISFSLYLWHWPVIVFLGLFVPAESALFIGTAFALSAILSMASFHGVENPIRHSNWLDGRAAQRYQSRRGSWTQDRLRFLKAGMIVGLLPVTALLSLQALAYTEPTEPPVAPQPVSQGSEGEHDPPIEEVDAPGDPTGLAVEIAMATEARDWPEFAISLDALEDAKVKEWTEDKCIDIGDADLQRCTYDGPADHSVLVLGDSVAVSWIPALRAGLAPEGFATTSVTMGQCPAAHVAVVNNVQQGGFAERCAGFQQWASDVVDDMQPDVVVLSSAENSLGRLSSGASGDAQLAEWAEGMSLAIEAVQAEGRHVVVLAPPPEGINLQGCITRFNGPTACTSTIAQQWLDQREVERLATERASATYIDSSEWFCRPDGVCPAFVGDLPVRADGNHLTAGYATKLGPQLRDALLTGSVAGDALEG